MLCPNNALGLLCFAAFEQGGIYYKFVIFHWAGHAGKSVQIPFPADLISVLGSFKPNLHGQHCPLAN